MRLPSLAELRAGSVQRSPWVEALEVRRGILRDEVAGIVEPPAIQHSAAALMYARARAARKHQSKDPQPVAEVTDGN